MKILFIGVTSTGTVNFRLKLFEKLISDGFEVFSICSDSDKQSQIEAIGVHFYCVPFNNRSVNVFSFNKITNSFRKIIREVNPDVIFTYQLKGNIFGAKAAIKENKSFICLNEGLGDGFGSLNSFKGRLIRRMSIKLHKKYVRNAYRLIALNKDDGDFFISNKICSPEQLALINGVGVDCNKFEYCKLPEKFSVLNVSRLVRTKGVVDYCEIAKLVREKDKDIEFHLVGPEVDVTKEDLSSYIKSGDIIYDGVTTDVRPFVKNSSIVVLPSYREGFAISLVEAGSMGRPVIAYDVTGPNAFIQNGKTGFLIPFQNKKLFSEKILFLKQENSILQKMSKDIRKHVLSYCDVNTINKALEDLITNCYKNK